MTDNSVFLRKLFADPDEQPPVTGTESPAPKSVQEPATKTASADFLHKLFNN